MTDPEKITPETVGRLAGEIVGVPVAPGQRQAVAELLQALVRDMASMRRLNVGIDEPAPVYVPAENAS